MDGGTKVALVLTAGLLIGMAVLAEGFYAPLLCGNAENPGECVREWFSAIGPLLGLALAAAAGRDVARQTKELAEQTRHVRRQLILDQRAALSKEAFFLETAVTDIARIQDKVQAILTPEFSKDAPANRSLLSRMFSTKGHLEGLVILAGKPEMLGYLEDAIRIRDRYEEVRRDLFERMKRRRFAGDDTDAADAEFQSAARDAIEGMSEMIASLFVAIRGLNSEISAMLKEARKSD